MRNRNNLDWLRRYVQEERPSLSQLEEMITKKTGKNGAEVVRQLFKRGYLDRSLHWHD